MKVGILGGGQLARMLALAGHPLGIRTITLDPAADACSAPVAQHLHGAYDDLALIDQMAEQCDALTFEFEHIPQPALDHLAQLDNVFPSPNAVRVAQDRLREKDMFSELAIPVSPYLDIISRNDINTAVQQIGLPLVLKTRTEGYDGKGQYIIRSTDDIDSAWAELGGRSLIAEGFVDFDFEVSMIAVRGRNGELRYYPLSQNEHRNGILHLSHPCPQQGLQAEAEQCAKRVLEHLDYVGVLAFEFFVSSNGLLANEFAPRVHNSGHWTMDGAETSQFENHLRAVLGLPLGDTHAFGHCAMVNFVGTLPSVRQVLAIPGVHLHAYDKADRPGRKVGHANLRTQDAGQYQASLRQLLALAER